MVCYESSTLLNRKAETALVFISDLKRKGFFPTVYSNFLLCLDFFFKSIVTIVIVILCFTFVCMWYMSVGMHMP